MDISDLITADEAAKILGYERSSVTLLCRQGKMEGAIKRGHMWLIPRTTVGNYRKAPQGFAAIWERRRKEEIESGHETISTLRHEIWQGLKDLTEKMTRLEKLIAQEKSGD